MVPLRRCWLYFHCATIFLSSQRQTTPAELNSTRRFDMSPVPRNGSRFHGRRPRQPLITARPGKALSLSWRRQPLPGERRLPAASISTAFAPPFRPRAAKKQSPGTFCLYRSYDVSRIYSTPISRESPSSSRRSEHTTVADVTLVAEITSTTIGLLCDDGYYDFKMR